MKILKNIIFFGLIFSLSASALDILPTGSSGGYVNEWTMFQNGRRVGPKLNRATAMFAITAVVIVGGLVYVSLKGQKGMAKVGSVGNSDTQLLIDGLNAEIPGVKVFNELRKIGSNAASDAVSF